MLVGPHPPPLMSLLSPGVLYGAMRAGRTAGIEDLPPHVVADIVRLASDADRRLLTWLRLSLVSRCTGASCDTTYGPQVSRKAFMVASCKPSTLLCSKLVGGLGSGAGTA